VSACAITGAVLFGFIVALAAHLPVLGIASLIRRMSGLPWFRDPSDVGVPPWIVGVFERMMAFLLVYYFGANGDSFTILLGWIGLKLASNWQRRPLASAPISPKEERAIRICRYRWCRGRPCSV
jgi:hypothetical protein